MIKKPLIRIDGMGVLRAGVIIRTEDHVVLVRTRHKDPARCVWGFPKGRVQAEDSESASPPPSRKQSSLSDDCADAPAPATECDSPTPTTPADTRAMLRTCAERELYEETGIRIELAEDCPVVRVANVRLFIHRVDRMFPLHYATIPDKHEILDIRWIPWKTLHDGTLPMNHSLRSYLKKRAAAGA